MARNEEKQLTRLNRMLLEQQRKDDLEKNPVRPKLITLQTAKEIQHWLPSIQKDLDFYLKQSEVPCYPERKIREFEQEISRLKREYQAFVRRLRELDPTTDVVPWTERSYSQRKRTHSQSASQQGSEKQPPTTGLDPSEDKARTFISSQRIPLPILASKFEKQYEEERAIEKQFCHEGAVEKTLMFHSSDSVNPASNDTPLTFESPIQTEAGRSSKVITNLALNYSSSESDEDT